MADASQLWHVTLTLGGERQDARDVRASLERLMAEHPFTTSVRYGERRAEIQYWEESGDLVDAASLALRLWREHRQSAGLPDWQVIGLEVLDRDTYQRRDGTRPMAAAAVAPQRF